MQKVASEYADTLPPPEARTHVHTRNVEYRGYHREDGLWDIEAELTDTKTYAHERPDVGVRQAGEPVHGMRIRLTIDDHMRISDVAVAMPATPFVECQQAKPPMRRLIGHTMGRGWRRTIADALGGTQSCTHLRELLFNMATVAYQTMAQYLRHLGQLAGVAQPIQKHPPRFVGQCVAWAFDGSVVKRVFPQFASWKAKKD